MKELFRRGAIAAALSTLLAAPFGAQAAIPGVSGTGFSLDAKAHGKSVLRGLSKLRT